MNLRCCVLLSVASALAACGLFEDDKDRDTDAIEPTQDESAQAERDAAADGQDSDPPASAAARDAARAERDASSASSPDAGRPASGDPARTIDGGPARSNQDAGFDWVTDGAVLSAQDASASVRDGGLIRFDPDANGPVLNPEAQTACIGPLNRRVGSWSTWACRRGRRPNSRRATRRRLAERCGRVRLMTSDRRVYPARLRTGAT